MQQQLSITIFLALVASPCLARSNLLHGMQDEALFEMLMSMEIPEHHKALEHSLAVHMLQEGVQQAENKPIPGAAGDLKLNTLVQLVTQAGLVKALQAPGPFTLFGPTDTAFTNVPAWVKEAIKNVTVLTEVLTFHVLNGKVNSSALKNELLVPTLNKKELRVNLYTVDKATVATVQCAPIDLQSVDNPASNGLIHVLNAVMIPPAGNAVATLIKCPSFKILVKAVQVAGLVDTLSGPGPFTVFAPTDKAFGKLPAGTLEKLLKNPTLLAKILTYHVVPGTYCSSGLSSGAVKTVEGQDVNVKVTKDGVTVNDAKVIVADGSITNGVVHAIDTVLLPPGLIL